jgi:hypothetical protein
MSLFYQRRLTYTRLLIETANELRRNARKLVREAKADADKLKHSQRRSQQLLAADKRKSGQRGYDH